MAGLHPANARRSAPRGSLPSLPQGIQSPISKEGRARPGHRAKSRLVQRTLIRRAPQAACHDREHCRATPDKCLFVSQIK